MKASDDCMNLIKRSEGFRAETYLDAAGKATIGYGHLLKACESFHDPITEDQAEQILLADMQIAADAVTSMVKVDLKQGQFDALVDFVFNMGAGRLQTSTLLRLLNLSQYTRIPDELRRWVIGGGKKLPGLMVRREAEVALWEKA